MGILDEAVLPRLSLALHLQLDSDRGRLLWSIAIRNLRQQCKGNILVTDNDVESLTQECLSLNATQIFNALRTAQRLAILQGETINIGHILQMVRTTRGFEDYIRPKRGEMAQRLGLL